MPDPNYDDIPLLSPGERAMTHDEVTVEIPALPLGTAISRTSSGHSATSVAPAITSITGELNDQIGATLLKAEDSGRLARRSSSMITLRSSSQGDDCSTDSIPTDSGEGEENNWGSDDFQSSYGTFPLHSDEHDTSDDSGEWMQQHTEGATLSHELGPWHIWNTRRFNRPFQRANPVPLGSLARVSEKHYGDGKDLPLKSNMKHKSRSYSTTLAAEELSLDSIIPALRRVKTVNFADAMSKETIPPLPPQHRLIERDSDLFKAEDREAPYLPECIGRSAPNSNQVPLYTALATKGAIADTAITKTNVHVVSGAPQLERGVPFDQGGVDSGTPRNPDMESVGLVRDNAASGGEYLWRRRGSSASQLLHTLGLPTLYGPESGSLKLVDWKRDNSGQDHPSKIRKVLLSSNDDGDDRLGIPLAPPNSRATSARTSRLPSQNTSDCASYGEKLNEAVTSLKLQNYTLPQEKTLKPEVIVTCPAKESDPMEGYPLHRVLSNLDVSDIKFRGHRDSVTLERNRLLKSRGIAPELLEHGYSMMDVRKKVHARRHARSDSFDNYYLRPMPLTLESLGRLQYEHSNKISHRTAEEETAKVLTNSTKPSPRSRFWIED